MLGTMLRLGIAIPDPFSESRDSGLEDYGIMGSRLYGIKKLLFWAYIAKFAFFVTVSQAYASRLML